MNTVYTETAVESTAQGLNKQIDAQAALHQGQGGGTGSVVIVAPAAPQPTAFSVMRAARRWLIASPKKQPFYIDGTPRSGTLDSPQDVAKLASYEEAKAALLKRGPGWMLGFALGPDETGNCWQGIDLDHIEKNGLSDIAKALPGYVEVSPSGNGCHAIGYGRRFSSMGSNNTGIEAYAGGRYFTVTECLIRDNELVCLAHYIEEKLAPRRSAKQGTGGSTGPEMFVPDKTVSELRSALLAMRSDEYDLWIKIGLSLRELGDRGRALWLEWSSTSEKFNAQQAAKTWESFKPKGTGYQAVFSEATRHGWVNPGRNDVQLAPAAVGPINDFHSKIPQNFINEVVAPPLDLANVPEPVAAFARSCSSAYGFDLSGLVMAALTAAAAMMDDGYQLEVMPRWHVSARLWTVLIGKSASGKSPILKKATAPIKAKHNEFAAEYDRACESLQSGEPRPIRLALYTSDATIEALSERLRENPRGMLVLTEEFSSWIGGIDSSSKGDAAKNRGNWLQLYDGGSYQVDRVMRGSILIENWGASILTASTPSGLSEQLKYLPEDGLIQRFIPVIVGTMNHSADGDAGEQLDSWKNWLFWIHGYTSQHPLIRFSPKARELFMKTKADLGRMAESSDAISGALASHISKHTEMVARLALVFHVFDPRQPQDLSVETLQMAVNLMGQLRKHSVALFADIFGASPSADIARALARSLAAADPGQVQTIGRDWMTQHCRAFEKAKDDRIRREAVQLLEDFDWLRDAGTGNYAGWPKKFDVNRNIFRLYAREGEVHRAKRAAVKALFEDQISH